MTDATHDDTPRPGPRIDQMVMGVYTFAVVLLLLLYVLYYGTKVARRQQAR